MKKFVRFYYRCSFKVCLWAFLSLIGFTVLSSPAFAQCTQYTPCTYGDYKYKVSNGTVTITQYIGAGGDVVIPSNINSMPVVGIDGYYEIDYYGYWYYGAFEDHNSVTSVTIPNSVTSIGYSGVWNVYNLTSVTTSLIALQLLGLSVLWLHQFDQCDYPRQRYEHWQLCV